ncbi:DUF397 domain-containing protein [Stackebrandtia sp.]|uniref:DUF397 domain-containing protein n=1 Tax=Stackebrandtia sp. TaxID=2023065 RepID=UPI0032C24601
MNHSLIPTTQDRDSIAPFTWRASSRSSSNGGQNCIEVALRRKSTRSGNSGGQNCIEVSLSKRR